MKPNIDLQIGELILRGLPYAQRHRIAAAVVQELTRLLSEQGLPPSLAAGGAIPHISVNDLRVANGRPSAIGIQIAQGVYENLAGNGTGGEIHSWTEDKA